VAGGDTMIYQCYFKKEQEQNLFSPDCYQGFGLEPELNSTLFKNCPELKDAKTRLALTEYACFLWFYRNLDCLEGDYFGTTSYRQLIKQPTIFESQDHLDSLKDPKKIVTWGMTELLEQEGYPLPISIQTEIAHPGMTSYINEILDEVPEEWYSCNKVIFANYWYMHKDLFVDFMDFSWPLVQQALKDQKHPYFSQEHKFGADKRKAVGYFMERLFILWTFKRKHPVVVANPETPLRSPLRIYL
jgi:hypothetical protein